MGQNYQKGLQKYATGGSKINKETSFPVRREDVFGSYLLHRKRGRNARASLSPHHTLDQEQTARFTARPFSALVDMIVAPLR